MADRGSRADHLDAALDLLAEAGPKDGGLRLALDQICEVTGLGRSSIYRYWPTLGQLAEEVLVSLATSRPGWRTALLGSDPARPLADTLADPLHTQPWDAGQTARCLVSTWPEGHAGRATVVARERAERAELRRWLQAHLDRAGRRPVAELTSADLALALTATLDGTSIMKTAYEPRLQGQPWTWMSPDHVLRTVEGLVEETTEPGRSAEPPIGPPAPLQDPHASLSPRARLALTAVADAVARVPVGHDPICRPTRVVDLGRLARRLAVSERRLLTLWPSADDLNADLATGSIARLGTLLDTTVDGTLTSLLEDASAAPAEQRRRILDAMIRRGATPPMTTYFACAFGRGGADGRDRSGQAVAQARRRHGVTLMAMLQIRGYHLADGFDVDPYAAALFSSFLGAQVTIRLDPSCLPPPGSVNPLALAVRATFDALSAACGHPEHVRTPVRAAGGEPSWSSNL